MTTLSEAALVLAPLGRDAQIAAGMLAEVGIEARMCTSLPALVEALEEGAGFGIVTEESVATADLHDLADWLGRQAQWSDFPFILLTGRGGGLERNPAAGRYLEALGNVTFLERPFHPTTLISAAKGALRARRRQYEARSRMEALHESERQFRTLADSIPTLCWMARADGHVFWYNQRWYDYTGTSPADMEGWGWQSVHDPAMLPEVSAEWGAALAEGRPFEMVFPMKSASGRYRSFLTRVQPVRGADGAIVRWFGTNTDITDQQDAEEALRQTAADLEQRVDERTAEREAALAQLYEAQKLETLGQLTGGVAHDFNNLLTPITGSLDLLQRKYGEEDPRTARLVANAIQAADRAKTLTERLLGFARRQELRTAAVDLAVLMDGMRDLIRSSIGPDIEVTTDFAAGALPAAADANQIELAILNLCVNARDAMPEGGLLTIRLEQVERALPKGLAPGIYLRLSVTDTGCGMDAETLARAVEPFYSTKETGRGTGLGLSMIHGLAGQLGGAFELASGPGQGTRADLWLPAAPPGLKALDHAAPAPPEGSLGRVLEVLLVDDEPLVRIATADLIRDIGHRVTEAEGGLDALAKLTGGFDPDLVVTDYKMPGMDGAELARQIKAKRPRMPVLLITGYTGTASGALDIPRLAKPFGRRQIEAAISAVAPR